MQQLLSTKYHTIRLALCLFPLISIIGCNDEGEEEILYRLLEEEVVLGSQGDVNDFAAQKITHLRGSLTLQSRNGDPSPITDISGLTRLTTIEGSLTISGTSITQVDAFSNLTQLDGELVISFNEALENLDGFIALGNASRVLETIRIRDNPKLTAINQFDNVVEIESGLFIWNNESLAEVEFSGLIRADIVGFSENPRWSDLTGFSNLQKVTQFRLSNTILTSLEGLESLKEVDYIYLQENHQITSIDQFSELTEVPIAVDFYDNKALASVNFSNLRSTGFLRIHNTWMKDLSGFPALERVQDVQLTENDQLLDLEKLTDTSIEGWLWLSGSQITTLELVKDLDLSGGFGIQNSGITDLKGLEHMETIEEIYILDNRRLTSLDGLQNLSRIGDEISISRNPLLENLEGLNALARVDNHVRIYGCTSLKDYCALELLVADGVAVFAEIEQNAYNPTLQDIRRGDCKL
ncbi:MAG: hypothetical protein R8G66_17780 [Cytophagales bacterium]|nr:hypothetical protein [Cytophagales bacterium]